ncbi:MAG: ABC transporter permease [Gammaproteobacteria bacterium]|nr:ABC transporter permease [Gammaproteobacteria bacterium]MDH5694371.1 ABC transporter permease [Gammaproteobacteria bacterium]
MLVRSHYVHVNDPQLTEAKGLLAKLRRYDRLDVIYLVYGLMVVSAVVLSYFLGAFNLLPFDPEEMDLEAMMAPVFSNGHILGTDFMGRDLLSRLILGIQAYFLPGLLAITIALTIGSTLGVLAGYYGRRWDTGVTYFNNLLDSFPRLVLILLVVAAFKPNIYYIMMVVGLTNVPNIAALIKNKILFLKQKNFIESAIALGIPAPAIIFRHILWYNCRAVLVIQATLGMGEAILMETSLSYLGFGVQEPTPSWGNMVQAGSNYLLQGDFWPSTAPALFILLTILGFYLLGDALNNILEGKKSI